MLWIRVLLLPQDPERDRKWLCAVYCRNSSVEDGLPVADGILRDPDQLRDCHTWEGFDAQVEDKKQE